MNLPAIQHFAFDNFCYQLTDDDLEISINTGKDVDKVFIVAGDPFAAGILGGDWQWNGKETEIQNKISSKIILFSFSFKLLSLIIKLSSCSDSFLSITFKKVFISDSFVPSWLAEI